MSDVNNTANKNISGTNNSSAENANADETSFNNNNKPQGQEAHKDTNTGHRTAKRNTKRNGAKTTTKKGTNVEGCSSKVDEPVVQTQEDNAQETGFKAKF